MSAVHLKQLFLMKNLFILKKTKQNKAKTKKQKKNKKRKINKGKVNFQWDDTRLISGGSRFKTKHSTMYQVKFTENSL